MKAGQQTAQPERHSPDHAAKHNVNFHQKNRRRPTDRPLAAAAALVPPLRSALSSLPTPSLARGGRGRDVPRRRRLTHVPGARARGSAPCSRLLKCGLVPFLGRMPPPSLFMNGRVSLSLSFDVATLGILNLVDREWPGHLSGHGGV